MTLILRVTMTLAAIPVFLAIGGLVLVWKCLYMVASRIDGAIDGVFDQWM